MGNSRKAKQICQSGEQIKLQANQKTSALWSLDGGVL